MAQAIATIQHIKGETIVFGLRATDPAYDGTETVTCDVKVAGYGKTVPSSSTPVALSITPVFQDDAWLFTITSTQSGALDAGFYITDAKVVSASGVVDYPRPLAINLSDRVTE
jgi:hypothetical protein